MTITKNEVFIGLQPKNCCLTWGGGWWTLGGRGGILRGDCVCFDDMNFTEQQTWSDCFLHAATSSLVFVLFGVFFYFNFDMVVFPSWLFILGSSFPLIRFFFFRACWFSFSVNFIYDMYVIYVVYLFKIHIIE